VTIGGIILAIVIGLVAGLIARAVIPGKQHMGIIATIVLGLIGSLIGNLLAGLIQGEGLRFDVGGWWASILGAILVLGIYVAVQGRSRGSLTR
jgi:uncharacterized membrane protein YeaQ/YmgE (transglycosylase-associated protein family)